MKTNVFTFCFLLSIFSICLFSFSSLAQAPNWDSVYADYFIKYQPVDTPAWLFPICFKDYDNEWDTVYIGHDKNGSGINTEFGEGWLKLDTSIFNATLVMQADSGYKVRVNNIGLGDSFSIQFTKGRMPLTMYWSDSLFYSDSLPFPDLGPLPRVRGELWCNDFDPQFSICPVDFPIIMTDNPDSIPPITPPFWASDSIFFDGDTADYMGTSPLLYIVPYNESWLGSETKNDPDNHFKFYPNPCSKKLTIENKEQLAFTYNIFNYLGQSVITGKGAQEQVSIDVSGLSKGMHFIQITTEKNTVIKKIMKAG